MAKRRPKRTGEPGTEEFMEVGKEVVPGMRLRCICRGHTGTIGRIAWSPCGRFIASPSRDQTIRIWDANDGKCIAVLQGHRDEVHGVAWSPDASRLATASQDGTVVIWARKTSQPIRQLHHNCPMFAVAWSRDGRTLATGGKDVWIRLYDEQNGSEICKFKQENWVFQLSWSPTLDLVASVGGMPGNVWFWDVANQRKLRTFAAESRTVAITMDWSPNGVHLAWGDRDGKVRILNGDTGRQESILEGHTDCIASVAYSSDGRLLASKGCDGQVRIWKSKERTLVARFFEESTPETSHDRGNSWIRGLAFDPTAERLATLGKKEEAIRIWDLDIYALIGKAPSEKRVSYTSAKIVLVGESNVGKSCLAMRLAEDRYPEDHEHGTTHGMRFWPMEAEELHSSAKPRDGERRDVVLWDFGGQNEYQLVHQMFLHDTTLALVLIDPTRGRTAMDEARDWNKRLEKHLEGKKAVKLLVGAKVDRASRLIDLNALKKLKKECGFAEFLDLSAKTGRNIEKLRKVIANALNWDEMAKTSRPELFQHIRDDVERRRKNNQVILTLTTFRRAIKRSAAKLYEEAAVDAVSDQMATQGIIVRSKLTDGSEALVLQLPVIERYAGSLIIAARNNPRGVPMLEERLLGSTKTIPLPGITKKERLRPAKERMVLECIVELMIQHGICFRHGGLLVFPTLFPAGGRDGEKLQHSVSLYYDFTGAIDNIYASLVSKLMVSEEFGEGRLAAGRVEFDRPGEGSCGIRQIKRTGGFAHVDLFFADETHRDRRDLFTRFVEEHLRANGVEIREHQAIKCKCGKLIEEEDVQANISGGEVDVICPRCRRQTPIGEGVERIRQRNPHSDASMVALRKTIDKRLAEDIKRVKQTVSKGVKTRSTDDPIRILHLSDLHFTRDTRPEVKSQWLLQDLRRKDGAFAAIDSVEYLVISGDATDEGKDEGFEKAREFVEKLVDELSVSYQRCILVPGNHDVQDRSDAYEEQVTAGGKKVTVRSVENFPKRFENFSKLFYHKIVQGEYPLAYAEQGIAYLFPDTGVQFLTLNSAWQIDEHGRKKSGMEPSAVAHVIRDADTLRKEAVARGDISAKSRLLRIGVWHHASCGPEMIKDEQYLSNLKKAEMRICLHGDVHEMRTDLIGYRLPGKMVDVVGAGSFGSIAEGRPESTPRLYNLLEVARDLKSVRVHTRSQAQPDAAWQGWHEWPDPRREDGRLPYFDIDLT